MADPLSIAGSVVGITAAGVQASVKLYALVEKVATASQRVTSIADDISSTCAILNQVRELIVPRPDAQGTLKSVFNSVALNDISHALRRCRASFTDIESLLRRAFEQVGKRPALHSKIELSRYEKAKWPFLQPQFDEMRNDLRDAKSNLVLMIAVASLALAQRDGRQRPIHDTERLELGSTIVHLQRASTVKTQPQHSSKSPRSDEPDLQDLFSWSVDADGTVSTRQTSMFNMANSAKALLPGPPALKTFTSPSSNRARGISSPTTGTSPANVSQAYFTDAQLRATFLDTMPHPSLEPSEPVQITARSIPGGKVSSRQAMAHGPSSPQESHLPDQPSRPEPTSSVPSIEVTPAAQGYEEQLQKMTAKSNADEKRYYLGWTTEHLPGFATGYGDSVIRRAMDLPQKSLEALVKTYTDEGNDPHIAMLELTREQQGMIAQSHRGYHEPEVVYVRLQCNVTVSSVFGILNAETLKWIVTLETGRDQPGRGYSQHYNSAWEGPTSISYDELHARQRDGSLWNQQMPASPSEGMQPSSYRWNDMGPSRPSIYHHHMTSNPPPSIYPEAIKRERDPHPRASAPEPARTHTLDTEDEAFDRTSVKFTDASKPGEYAMPPASDTTWNYSWAAQYTDPSTSMPPDVDLVLETYAEYVDSTTTAMPDADNESDDEVDADVEPVIYQILPGERPYHAQGPEQMGMKSLPPNQDFDFTQIANRQMEAMRSQDQDSAMMSAEDNGEDIVNELLARWTTS